MEKLGETLAALRQAKIDGDTEIARAALKRALLSWQSAAVRAAEGGASAFDITIEVTTVQDAEAYKRTTIYHDGVVQLVPTLGELDVGAELRAWAAEAGLIVSSNPLHRAANTLRWTVSWA